MAMHGTVPPFMPGGITANREQEWELEQELQDKTTSRSRKGGLGVVVPLQSIVCRGATINSCRPAWEFFFPSDNHIPSRNTQPDSCQLQNSYSLVPAHRKPAWGREQLVLSYLQLQLRAGIVPPQLLHKLKH